MSEQESSTTDLRTFSFATVARLLESVAAISDHHPDLMERRRAVTTILMHEIEADCGFWAWGYGNPTDPSITGVAMIDIGLSDEQRTGIAELSYDANCFQDFYASIYTELKGSPRTRSLLDRDFNVMEETKLAQARKYFSDCGWGTWLQNVRYFPEDAFSNLFFSRNHGRPAFTRKEADLVEVVCTSVSWLHANISEKAPPEKFARLTERQRTVLLMLLDGLPRKTIARRLGISEDTVGEHLTAIFACFEVSSALELAAIFLRNQ